MPQYALARHVFMCLQDEHVVFLDVRKDRYFALEAARTAGLGSLVPGWPVPISRQELSLRYGTDGRSSAVAASSAPELSSVLWLLLEKGILVSEVESGKPAGSVSREEIRGDLTADDADQAARISPMVFCRFVAAATRAALLLKYGTFESVIDRVAHRLARSSAGGRLQDLAKVPGLVSAFATLRPFFFTAKDACLFDALALSEFLASYAIYPRWVFGVQARPFIAHCWLQLDGVVLNDTVDNVRQYSTIMVV